MNKNTQLYQQLLEEAEQWYESTASMDGVKKLPELSLAEREYYIQQFIAEKQAELQQAEKNEVPVGSSVDTPQVQPAILNDETFWNDVADYIRMEVHAYAEAMQPREMLDKQVDDYYVAIERDQIKLQLGRVTGLLPDDANAPKSDAEQPVFALYYATNSTNLLSGTYHQLVISDSNEGLSSPAARPARYHKPIPITENTLEEVIDAIYAARQEGIICTVSDKRPEISGKPLSEAAAQFKNTPHPDERHMHHIRTAVDDQPGINLASEESKAAANVKALEVLA